MAVEMSWEMDSVTSGESLLVAKALVMWVEKMCIRVAVEASGMQNMLQGEKKKTEKGESGEGSHIIHTNSIISQRTAFPF